MNGFRLVALAAMLVASAPLRAQTIATPLRDNPWSPGSGGAWIGGTIGDPASMRAAENHNFAVFMKRSQFDKELMEDQDIIVDGAPAALRPPVVTTAQGGTRDWIDQFARVARTRYFPGEPLPQIEDYLLGRLRAYNGTMHENGMNARSLGSACDYFIEALYAAGRDIDASPARRNIHGTCLYTISLLQARGRFTTDVQRQHLALFLAIAGATYSDHHPHADAADARTAFKTLFNADIDVIEPDHVPCLFASDALPCDRILTQAPPLFDKLIAAYDPPASH